MPPNEKAKARDEGEKSRAAVNELGQRCRARAAVVITGRVLQRRRRRRRRGARPPTPRHDSVRLEDVGREQEWANRARERRRHVRAWASH